MCKQTKPGWIKMRFVEKYLKQAVFTWQNCHLYVNATQENIKNSKTYIYIYIYSLLKID